jgi:hypothetical protein
MEAPAFTLRLAADECLRIVDDAGCALHVVEGQLWITVDRCAEDIIAQAGDRVVLQRDDHAVVSAFRDSTLVLSARCGVRDVGFVLQQSDDESAALTVTAPCGDTFAQLGRWLWAGGTPTSRPLHAEVPLS